jgi:hypothetical protein
VLLDFKKDAINPTLNVSIRSLRMHRGAYLGLDGGWQSQPHYFSVERVVTESGPRFRLGPEAVNHLTEFDSLEICTNDKWICETGDWDVLAEECISDFHWPPTVQETPAPFVNVPRGKPVSYPRQNSVEQNNSLVSVVSERQESANLGVPRWPLFTAFSVVLLCSVIFAVPSKRCTVFGVGCVDDAHENTDSAREKMQHALITQKSVRGTQAIQSTQAMQTFSEFSPAPQNISEGFQEEQKEQKADSFSHLLTAARKCSRGNPCLGETCFAELQTQTLSAPQAAEVLEELSKARKACGSSSSQATPLPDGIYSARALAGCGIGSQFAIRVKVRGNQISWQHDAPLSPGGSPLSVQWKGTIDVDGNIHATVGNASGFSAEGRFDGSEREVKMHYPGCKTQNVTLIISGRRIK